MNRYLLDVSVLVSVIDPMHSLHQKSLAWFIDLGSQSWATCPITQNGTVRIVSQPNYPNPQSPPSIPIQVFRELTAHGNHEFISDDVSILDSFVFDFERLLTPRQITDTYLLALAARHDAILATHDRNLVTTAVRLPGAKVHLI